MKTLILVDIQMDFCSDGALEVDDGDSIVPVANKLMKANVFDLVVASKDHHPKNHGSFASNQGTEPFTIVELNGFPQTLWPDHCVAGTYGAELNPGLNVEKISAIIHKGMDPKVDSYSAFFDNEKRNSTGLGGYIAGLDCRLSDVYIMGLATDYCVKFTALDSVDFGFNTYLIKDGCRGVNMEPAHSHIAIEEMKEAAITIVNSEDLLNVI